MGELIGYARCSTVLEDLTAQREILTGLAVAADRIYLDKGLAGINRAWPGLDQPWWPCAPVTPWWSPRSTASPARSPTPATSATPWSPGASRCRRAGPIYDPGDPMSKMFFTMLAVFAEFEADLLKMRTREGMAIARSSGKLKGKKPKLTARKQAEHAEPAPADVPAFRYRLSEGSAPRAAWRGRLVEVP